MIMDYLAQNALGFEGDTFLKEEIERLVKKHEIAGIIETGTYMGATTLQFESMGLPVVTIEANEEYYHKAVTKFEGKNILHRLGNSVDILPLLMPFTKTEFTYLFFLDAHWGEDNPLLQELAIIAESKIKPVIIIHDFKVPNHPELGFDSYGGQDYEWSWIEKSIENIYGKDGYNYHYNTEVTGAKRGVIFIEPK